MNLGIDSELKESALFTTSGWTGRSLLRRHVTLQQVVGVLLRNSMKRLVIHRCE
jgi:hypothetical protein